MSDFWWKALRQNGQWNGRMSVWMSRCVLRVDERRKALPQRWHVYGLSALCCIRCRARLVTWPNVLWHVTHWNGRWRGMCARRECTYYIKKHFLKRDGSILNSTPIYTHDTIIVISLHAGHKIGSSKLKLTLIPYTITWHMKQEPCYRRENRAMPL